MKNWIVAFFFIPLVTSTKAQVGSIELIDLLKTFAIDSSSANKSMPWQSLPSMPGVLWQSKMPVSKNNSLSMSANANISLYQKLLTADQKGKPAVFRIRLDGNANGYTKFSLDHGLSPNIHPRQSMDYLFSQPMKFRLYKKHLDSAKIVVNSYEIKLPGKKPFWLTYGTMFTSTGNGIYLKGYLNEKDLLTEYSKEPRKQGSGISPTSIESLQFLSIAAENKTGYLDNKSLVARLKKMLGKEYNTFMMYQDMSVSPTAENGLFYSWNMQAHHGGENETTLLADINKNLLYVIILKNGKKYYYAEDGGNSIPAYLLAWEKKIYNRDRGL